jgi:hypothetical protein
MLKGAVCQAGGEVAEEPHSSDSWVLFETTLQLVKDIERRLWLITRRGWTELSEEET